MYYHFMVRLLNEKKYDEAANLAAICYRRIREEQVEEGFNNPVLQIEAERYYNYLCFAYQMKALDNARKKRANREKEIEMFYR